MQGGNLRGVSGSQVVCLILNVIAMVFVQVMKFNAGVIVPDVYLNLVMIFCALSALIALTRLNECAPVFTALAMIVYVVGVFGGYLDYTGEMKIFEGGMYSDYRLLEIIAMLIASAAFALYMHFAFKVVFKDMDVLESFRSRGASAPVLRTELADDEVLIKSYECTTVDYTASPGLNMYRKDRKSKKHRTSGYMFVTDRRLIYEVDSSSLPALGRKCADLYTQELCIDDIYGVDTFRSTMFRNTDAPWLLILLGVINLYFIIGVPVLIAGLIWLRRQKTYCRQHMMLGIRTRDSEHSVFVSEMSRGYAEDTMFWSAPASGFEDMAAELGAVILDIQKDRKQAAVIWS